MGNKALAIASSNYTAIVRINRESEVLTNWYLNEEQKNINILESALTKNDFRLIVYLGNNLYGHGATYGFNYVSKMGKSIELAAIKKDSDLLCCLINSLKAYWQNVQIHYV